MARLAVGVSLLLALVSLRARAATPTYYLEQDFVNNPNLAALPSQAVVLSLAASGSPQHVVRYQLPAAAYQFCLGNNPALTASSLSSSSGQIVATVKNGQCVSANLPADTYRLNVVHDPTKVTGNPRIIFAQLPVMQPKATNADGTVKTGYWAVQPDPAQDPTGAGRTGRIHALPPQDMKPSSDSGDYSVFGMPLAVDWSSPQFDDTALFRFDTPQILANQMSINFYPVPNEQDVNFNAVLFGNTDKYPNYLQQTVIEDRADGTIRIGAISQNYVPLYFFHFAPRFAFAGATSFLTFPALNTINPPPPSLLSRVLFRFYPSSQSLTAPGPEQGEVEISQSCGYQGNVSVFMRSLPDLGAISSPTTNLTHAASVTLGPNTEAVLYPEPNFAGTAQVIQADISCLQTQQIGSIEIRPATPQLTVAGSCIACQLQGINLSNTVLDSETLSGTDLSGSNLNGTSLVGTALDTSTLNHATISQAHLDQAQAAGSSWSGVDLRTAASFDHVVLDRAAGFGGADLTGIQLPGASLQDIDFNFTKLVNAKLPEANLTGANLRMAHLDGADLTKAVLPQADLYNITMDKTIFIGANLTDSLLEGNTFATANLTGAHLDGSRLFFSVLDGANLTGTTFVGTKLGDIFLSYTLDQLRVANLNGAVFDKGSFANQNLSGINFSGASMQGTTFTDVSFTPGPTTFQGTDLTKASFVSKNTHVNLSGANFNGAILHGTGLSVALGTATFIKAQMQGALMNSADFTGADMTQADMTGANLTNVGLSAPASMRDAVLDGAIGLAGGDLTNAQLSNLSMQNTNLSGAHLYGAQLNNSNLDGSNLSGAFLTKGAGASAANLTGAFLRNVNLSQAQLDGANFTNANFFSTTAVGTSTCVPDSNGWTANCATASGATMNATNFSGAYLFGVDFTSAKAQGVSFGNSFLAGSNFFGAVLSAAGNGSDTGFASAFLQGVNMLGVTLQNGISLDDAFVDFTGNGNTINLVLGGSHTSFSGYWGDYGKNVCAQMAYNQPTAPPRTDRNVLCPNGSTNLKGCGPPCTTKNCSWDSPVDITQIASYTQNSTFTNAPKNQICTADIKWVPIGLSKQTKQQKNAKGQ